MATFLVLLLAWVYIIFEIGTLYYEHVIKHKISASEDMVISTLHTLFEKLTKKTDNEQSIITELIADFLIFKHKYQILWICVLILTGKKKYVHSI